MAPVVKRRLREYSTRANTRPTATGQYTAILLPMANAMVGLLIKTHWLGVWLQVSGVKSFFTGRRGSLYIRQSE
jgi:hypothetical protein